MTNQFELRCKKFMYIYMYELENLLKYNVATLKLVSFSADEANTDRPLKEYIKNLIETYLTHLPLNTLDKSIEINYNNDKILLPYISFKDLCIAHVYLPDMLTEELKDIITQSKSSVYTNPDLYLEVSDGTNTEYVSIELKSTKSNAIPGSSIQQVDPNEWVIFIKHSKGSLDIVTGQYIYSINSKLQFPDRSPRPQVAFNELKGWNSRNRKTVDSKTTYTLNPDDEKIKYELLNNWQEHLANRWVEVLFDNTTKANEPWFNNNLRIFILKFIDKYENLTNNEKAEYKEMIKLLIKE